MRLAKVSFAIRWFACGMLIGVIVAGLFFAGMGTATGVDVDERVALVSASLLGLAGLIAGIATSERLLHRHHPLAFLLRHITVNPHDRATGMESRLGFLSALTNLLYLHQDVRLPFVVIYLRLNNLPYIERQLGPQGRDASVKMLTQALVDNRRAGDLLARLSRDEYGVTLIGADEKGADVYLTRVRKAMAPQTVGTDADGQPVPLVLWVGVATPSPSLQLTAEQMLSLAAERCRPIDEGLASSQLAPVAG